jgi:hypothetical protein
MTTLRKIIAQSYERHNGGARRLCTRSLLGSLSSVQAPNFSCSRVIRLPPSPLGARSEHMCQQAGTFP